MCNLELLTPAGQPKQLTTVLKFESSLTKVNFFEMFTELWEAACVLLEPFDLFFNKSSPLIYKAAFQHCQCL